MVDDDNADRAVVSENWSGNLLVGASKNGPKLDGTTMLTESATNTHTIKYKGTENNTVHGLRSYIVGNDIVFFKIENKTKKK